MRVAYFSVFAVTLHPVADSRYIVFTPPTPATPTTTPQPPPSTTTVAPCKSENITITLKMSETVAEVNIDADNKLFLGEGEHAFVSTENGAKCVKRIKIKKAGKICISASCHLLWAFLVTRDLAFFVGSYLFNKV